MLSAKPDLITPASFNPHLHTGFFLAMRMLMSTHAYPRRSNGQHPGHLTSLSGVQGCLESSMKLQGQSLTIPTFKCVSSRCLYLNSFAWLSPKFPSSLINFIVALDVSQTVSNEEL